MNKEEIRKEDHRLEQVAENGSRELARHRWHWTLDPSNPEAIGFTAYGKLVGRKEAVIRRYARLHEELSISYASGRTANEAYERASMGAETEAVTEAVAEARNLSFGHVRKSRHDEVKIIRAKAREAAEERGTTVEEEAPRIAQQQVKIEEALKASDERAKNLARKSGLGFIEMEAQAQVVIRELVRWLRSAETIGLEGDEKQRIEELLDRAREVLNLIHGKVSGAVVIDWDSELLQIAGKEV